MEGDPALWAKAEKPGVEESSHHCPLWFFQGWTFGLFLDFLELWWPGTLEILVGFQLKVSLSLSIFLSLSLSLSLSLFLVLGLELGAYTSNHSTIPFLWSRELLARAGFESRSS
jgi:hypothetical protein